jgi:hypothetical protein
MDFINAQEYTPNLTDSTSDVIKNGIDIKAIFHKDSAGQDWYESLPLWGADTLKVKVGLDGEILSFNKDIQALVPSVGTSIVEVENHPECLCDKDLGTCKFIDGEIIMQSGEEKALVDAEQYVSQQIRIVNMEIEKHLDGDERATATEQAWRDYRKQLRNYVKDGVVASEKPTAPSV